MHEAFAELSLTAWVRRHVKTLYMQHGICVKPRSALAADLNHVKHGLPCIELQPVKVTRVKGPGNLDRMLKNPMLFNILSGT